MALITCPECQQQMSDTAHACPRCGWARAALAAHAHQQQMAAQRAVDAEKMVTTSGRVAWVGVFVAVGGAIIAAKLSLGWPGIGAAVVIGIAVMTVGAVIGQVGRAKQGRLL
jgi:uncharacterized membrane protein YvbJ